jgi:hypothetical protein
MSQEQSRLSRRARERLAAEEATAGQSSVSFVVQLMLGILVTILAAAVIAGAGLLGIPVGLGLIIVCAIAVRRRNWRWFNIGVVIGVGLILLGIAFGGKWMG